MIASTLASMLLIAAPNATAQARESYARCLKDFVREGVEKKMDAAAFDTAFKSACMDKEASFKSVRMSGDLAMGLKRPAAEKALAEEIADYRLMAKEDYQDGLKLASAPQ